MIRAFYNDIDSYCCAWLQNLMDAGLITPGVISDKPIQELSPDDFAGFQRVHFFAGIAGWELALNLAGWGERDCWTGSCPCQPFSAAGKGKASSDERHLWPEWFRLIRAVRPPTLFGEQVEAAIGWGWLDLVHSDLEAEGYAIGAAVLPACGVGAPHIRQRLWFVGHADAQREHWRFEQESGAPRPHEGKVEGPDGQRLRAIDSGASPTSELADADASRCRAGRSGEAGDGRDAPRFKPAGLCADNHWSDLIWLPCTDGKQRPTQSPFQLMADGLPRSLGRVCPAIVEGLEKEIVSYAATSQTIPREILLDLRLALGAETLQRPTGGLHSVWQAPVLLSFLCQLADQGWHLAQGLSSARAQAPEGAMRGVRLDEAAARASCERGLDGPLHLLSSILARHAQAAWGEAVRANAIHPLAHGLTARVGRLRAAGNAVIPQVAAEFIKATM